MKYLIVGLGNPGDEYQGTRHNIGFMVLDALAGASNAVFEDKRYGFVAHTSVKNCQLVLLKPTTYMNLSGNAVRYWMKQENIQPENLLVVADDLALPLGKLRLRGQGSGGSHNGMNNIIQTISTQNFARLRVGIGNDFPMGAQIKFVLDKFPPEEQAVLDRTIPTAVECIKSFCLAGLSLTMTQFNKK
ncbi:MAG: aminoacyl-tRNA hydrolase [Bacteroidaceae bacterium]|nr:aminoacyl-tRNA hydrolase [Bacteroidaceae bacterium]